jgi:hypothetical protein
LPPARQRRTILYLNEATLAGEAVDLFVLLDFLMGHSIDELTASHFLCSRSQTEALLRAALLRGGYATGETPA